MPARLLLWACMTHLRLPLRHRVEKAALGLNPLLAAPLLALVVLLALLRLLILSERELLVAQFPFLLHLIIRIIRRHLVL